MSLLSQKTKATYLNEKKSLQEIFIFYLAKKKALSQCYYNN